MSWVRRGQALAGRPRHLAILRVVLMAYVVGAGWLAVAVMGPALAFGWQPLAVTSDSMAPSLEAGDVALVQSSAGRRPRPGAVVAIRTPDGERVVHRVLAVEPDGRVRTKGDANATPDSTSLAPGAVEGVVRLVVPAAGLPAAWLENGRALLTAAWGLLTLGAAIWLWWWRPRRAPPGPSAALRRLGRRLAPVLTGLVTVAAAVVVAPAGAVFSSTTDNTGNRFATASSFGIAFKGSLGTATCGATSSVITIAAPGVPLGRTVIVQVTLREAAAGAVTFSDSRGNTYTTDGDVAGSRTRTVVASAYVGTALQTGDTITVAHPDGKTEMAVASQWSGIAPTNRVDVAATASGSSTAPSASVTTTWPKTLLYGGIGSKEHNTYTEAGGYTTIEHTAGDCAAQRANNHAAYKITSSTGSNTYNPTMSTSREWTEVLVAYKEVDTVSPAAPSLSGSAGDAESFLSWTAVTDASTPITYVLYRNGAQVYSGTATSHNDTGLTNGTPYTYTVRALDAYGNQSPLSNEAGVTPVVGASIRFVRSLGSATCGAGSTVVTVPAAGVAAGHTIVMRVAIREGAATAFTATDTRGNAYTVDREQASAKLRMAVMSASVTTALQAGDTITVTHPDSKTEAVAVAQFSGISTTNRVDAVASATGSSASPSATITTTSQRTLLFGAESNVDALTVTDPADWTLDVHQSANCNTNRAEIRSAYRMVRSVGSYTYNPTLSASKEWVDVLVAYRSSDADPPPLPTLAGTAGDAETFLSWNSVSDPSPPVTYHLLRDGTEIYAGTATSYTDTGRVNGVTYSYAVQVSDGLGNRSGNSNAVSLKPVASASIQFVRALGTSSCGNTSSVISVPAEGVAATHTVIVRLSLREAATGAVTVTDSRGNTYTMDRDAGTTSMRSAVASAYVTTALQAGDTITVTHPDGKSEAATAVDFSGIASTNSLDSSAGATGSSTTPSASLTTVEPATLLYGAVANADSPTYTEASEFTTDQHQSVTCGSAASNHGAWRKVRSAATYTYNPTLSGSKAWSESFVAYKAAGPDTTAPAAPNLTGAAGHQRVDLSWNTVIDRSVPVAYRVLRDGTQVYSGQDTAFTDTGLANGTTYSYVVRAVDAAGNESVSSNTVSATPTADTTAPPAPSGLTGTVGNNSNTLSWSAVTDPTPTVTYQLFRDGTQVYSGTTTSYTDTGVVNGTSYTYTVKATDGAGNQSGASSPFTPTSSTVSVAVIGQEHAGDTGYVKQGGGYYVYVTATSGSTTITADVSNVTTGQTAVTLVAGSYTVNGTTYTHRSDLLTANATLSEGSKSFTVSPSGGTSVNATVTVDNTAPSAADVQTVNKAGGTVGRPEQGDQVVLTFSEPVSAESVLAGWNGNSTNVVVQIFQNGSTDDTVTVWNPGFTTQLPLGSVDTNGDPVSATTTFGRTGTASTMVRSGNTITITLGSEDAGGGVRTGNKIDPMVWTPSTVATDRAGNAMLSSTATESGSTDVDF